MSVTISRLADRPELIDQLVLAYEAAWPGWYGPGGRGDARADLLVRGVQLIAVVKRVMRGVDEEARRLGEAA